MTARINIHAISYGSRVNGPGERTVLHFQGCTLGCRGCINPGTWASNGGKTYSVETLLELILSTKSDGLTISGGEPFQQASGLFALLSKYKEAEPNKTVVVFTGYYLGELLERVSLYDYPIDLLVSGRYEMDKRYELQEAPPLLSSTNQKLILLTEEITIDDLIGLPRIEWDIDSNGDVITRGLP